MYTHLDFVQTEEAVPLPLGSPGPWVTFLHVPFITISNDNQALKLETSMLLSWTSADALQAELAIEYRILYTNQALYTSQPVKFGFLTDSGTTNQRPLTFNYVANPPSGAYSYQIQARVLSYKDVVADPQIVEASVTALVLDNLNPEASLVYASYEDNTGKGFVGVIDPAKDTPTAPEYRIPVGKQPGSICMTPDGKKVYVVNTGDNTVSIIDTRNNEVMDTLATGDHPVAVIVTPDNSKAYVANFQGKSVTIIDNKTNTVIDTVSVGAGQPFAFAACPNSWFVYTACKVSDNNDYVAAISTEDNAMHPYGGGWSLTFKTDRNPLVVHPNGHTQFTLGGPKALLRYIDYNRVGAGNNTTWLGDTVSGVYLTNGYLFATKDRDETTLRLLKNISIGPNATIYLGNLWNIAGYKGQDIIRVSPDQTYVCITITPTDDQEGGIQIYNNNGSTSQFVPIPVTNDVAITSDSAKAYIVETEYVHPVDLATHTSKTSIHFGDYTTVKRIVASYVSQS